MFCGREFPRQVLSRAAPWTADHSVATNIVPGAGAGTGTGAGAGVGSDAGVTTVSLDAGVVVGGGKASAGTAPLSSVPPTDSVAAVVSTLTAMLRANRQVLSVCTCDSLMEPYHAHSRPVCLSSPCFFAVS